MFSVIMPAYNAGKTIEKSIASVLNQTYDNFELIIINDCSTDDTQKKIELFSSNPKVKIVNNKKNLGVADSRNVGLDNAQGKFICFLDSDDFWYEHKLETQLRYLNDGHLIVCSNYDVINAEEQVIGERIHPELLTYSEMLKSNFIGNLTGCYSCEVLGKQRQLNKGHEDYIMWLELIKVANRAYCIQEKLGAYRISNASLSSNKLKALTWQWRIYRDVLGLSIFSSMYHFATYIYFGFKKRSKN